MRRLIHLHLTFNKTALPRRAQNSLPTGSHCTSPAPLDSLFNILMGFCPSCLQPPWDIGCTSHPLVPETWAKLTSHLQKKVFLKLTEIGKAPFSPQKDRPWQLNSQRRRASPRQLQCLRKVGTVRKGIGLFSVASVSLRWECGACFSTKGMGKEDMESCIPSY